MTPQFQPVAITKKHQRMVFIQDALVLTMNSLNIISSEIYPLFSDDRIHVLSNKSEDYISQQHIVL